MQAGFISAARWEIRDLAIWLVRRAVQVGSKEAIANLEEYSQATQFPAQVVHCLTGLKVETAVDIAPKISLVPWQEVPDAREKNTLFAKLGTYHMGVPSAALLKKVLFPKLHAPDTGNFLVQLDESDLRDALLCVGIVVPCAPALLVSWLNVPASVPHRGDTIYVAPTSLSARYDIWRAEHGPLGRKLFESFCALDDPRKDALGCLCNG